MSVSPITINSSTLAQAAKTVSSGDNDRDDKGPAAADHDLPGGIDSAQKQEIRAAATGVGEAVNVTA